MVSYAAYYRAYVSRLYNESIKKILPRIKSRAPLLSLTLKLINKFLIERD